MLKAPYVTGPLTEHFADDAFGTPGRLRQAWRLPGGAQGARRDDTRSCHRSREELGPARPRRRRLRHGPQMVLHAEDQRQAEIPGLQRRRVRAGLVQGPHPDGARPAPDPRRHPDRGLRDGRLEDLPLRARRIRLPGGSGRTRGRRGLREGLPRQEHPEDRVLLRRRRAARRGRLHLWRRDRPARIARRQEGPAAQEAALPRAARRLRHAHHGEQRRDVFARAAHHQHVARSGFEASAPRRARARRSSVCRATSCARASTSCRSARASTRSSSSTPAACRAGASSRA